MPNFKSILFFSLSVAALPAAHAVSFWQPLCPDGAVCATSNEAFVANGRVLLSPANSDFPSQWVDVASLAGAPTTMRDVSVATGSGHYIATSGPSFSAYDANGNLLYSNNHGNIEGWIIFESHAKSVGPALYFGASSPATIVSGLTLPEQLPVIYLTQDEGNSVTMQQANVVMDGGRTNFAVSADGQRVWVIPGPSTPGLWQTPAVAGTTAKTADSDRHPATYVEPKPGSPHNRRPVTACSFLLT